MLHRLKLRLLYAAAFNRDKEARKRKMRVILLSGFYTYPPFLAIAYFIAFETRAIALLIIGLLSALTCIPVVFYAYAKGFGSPFLTLFRERRVELLWLAIKIGFIYPFFLYFMMLGLVEFVFGYATVRAAMISFVAAAVARDGFEIGYYRARSPDQRIHIFPDGASILPYLKSAPLACILLFISVSCGVGFFLGPTLENPIHQILLAGIVVGVMTTIAYARATCASSPKLLARFFIWPGFTMAVTYFLGLLYIFRMMLETTLPPSVELALLMVISSAWLILEVQFVGYLTGRIDSG
ncbi:MAG: hypothetical protein HY201_04420 [Nitrospirae bacterium]|nr:hypothetical protein [Candidatus Troglogloeales bacterium]